LMGPVGCTSLITRLSTNLGALNNSSVNFIEEVRPCYGYESFRHARILKREHDGLYMIFENRGRLWLPNLGLSLYTVQVLLVDVQAAPMNRRIPRRAASVRMGYQPEPTWLDANPSPEAPVHTGYDDFDARNPCILRTLGCILPPNQLPSTWKKKIGHKEMMNNGNTTHTVSLQDTRLTLLEHHPLVPIMVITTRISNLDVLLMPDSTTPQRYMKRMWRSISALTTPSRPYKKTKLNKTSGGKTSASGMKTPPIP
jgi:hypothetical protein